MIHELTDEHVEALIALYTRLSEQDLTLIREDLGDHESVRQLPGQPGLRFVSTDGETVTGYVAVERLPGWSDHVGELRLVIDPTRRGEGLGQQLARHALTAALGAGVRKVVVELAAGQEGAIGLFSDLGFTGEALLRDHIRDRDGNLHDLVVLAHLADEGWGTLDAVGITDALGGR